MPNTTAVRTAQVGAAPFFAGKNKVINGDFGVWQRGTSFSNPATGSFTSDRWTIAFDGTPTTHTISQQTFTPGTAPVAGYEGSFFWRWAVTTAGTMSKRYFWQKIEDVRTFAGQTVTFSFWAKASTAITVESIIGNQVFGSGGSTFVGGTGQNNSLTTSWQRFTQTATVPSIAGKTIGTGSHLEAAFNTTNVTATIDIWGVQLEAGSTATSFQTATGTLQGELAACQRYFQRYLDKSIYQALTVGFAQSTTRMIGVLNYAMRTAPSMTVSAAGDLYAETGSSGWKTVTATGLYDWTSTSTSVYFDVASGLTTGQAGRMAAGSSNATLDLSAEL
jgi:hypothetical protein